MDLERLLTVQEHDSAIDHLEHRRATLPARQQLAAAEAEAAGGRPALADAQARRDEVVRAVKRLEDEATASADKAAEVEKTLYSGAVSSPRELQALQADLQQLQRHQRSLEDRELELMEQQEALDAEVDELEGRVTAAVGVADAARATLAAEEAEIDEEVEREVSARARATEGLDGALLADYDRARAHAGGVGAARLVGQTCQGCRLTIPRTEVERIKREGAAAGVAHCDNCGAILVPST
jgi:predicted  nucleic acid-binding Zn-ribbon protein